MDDHRNLPADYLESCQRFFLELDRKQSEKQKGKYEYKRRLSLRRLGVRENR